MTATPMTAPFCVRLPISTGSRTRTAGVVVAAGAAGAGVAGLDGAAGDAGCGVAGCGGRIT